MDSPFWPAFTRVCRAVIGTSLPNRCLLCHQTISAPRADSLRQTGICSACLTSAIYQQHCCLGCGKTLQVAAEFCGGCVAQRPIKVIAPASYHSMLGPLIPAIKYQAQFAALPALVDALAARITALVELHLLELPQVIIPVPLHPQRLRQRGYNQAWLIAQQLSERLQLPVDDALLLRINDTAAQARLTGKQRRNNLAGAFALTHASPYQRIALVDDVVTTGSTINEIAKLFRASAPSVQAWCLARAEAPSLLSR